MFPLAPNPPVPDMLMPEVTLGAEDLLYTPMTEPLAHVGWTGELM